MDPCAHGIAVLLIEDDPLFVRALTLQLGRATQTSAKQKHKPFDIRVCAHTGLALQQLQQPWRPDVILLDVHLGGHEEGLAALPRLLAAAPNTLIVVHSVLTDHATIVRAMRLGAHDYIPKHMGFASLAEQLRLLVARHRRDNLAVAALAAPSATQAATTTALAPGAGATATSAAAPALAGMLGDSEVMQQLRRDIAVVRRSHGSVVILGEPGAGKELVARAVAHNNGPFVSVDAATLDTSLASSMLFGSVRGAYTGAERDTEGLFEQANGGTLYLDEVANLSLDVQAKLLRVLQEREVTRLGCRKRRALQFRLVCATHANLAQACRLGQFRFDLWTRLQVFVLRVPALRERPQDILPLFEHFLARHQSGSPVPVANDLQAALLARSWAGNVRELKQAAEVAWAKADGAPIAACHLPPALPQPRMAATAAMAAPAAFWGDTFSGTCEEVGDAESGIPGDFYARVRAFERRTLISAYAQAHGNISAMARTLGLDRSSLYAKLRLHAIHVPKSAH